MNVELDETNEWPETISGDAAIESAERLAFVKDPYANVHLFGDYAPLDVEDTRDWQTKLSGYLHDFGVFIRSPRNIFDLTLIVIVGISGAFLVLMLIFSVPPNWTQSDRDYWIEVMSQLLNAVFTVWAIMNTWPRSVGTHTYLQLRRAWKDGRQHDYDALRRQFQLGPPLWQTHLLSDPDSSRDLSVGLPMERPDTVKSTAPFIAGKELPIAERFPTPVPNLWVGWMLILLLLNIVLQIPLSLAMWLYAASYKERPQWIIALFLPFCFLSVFVAYAWLYGYDYLWSKKRRLYFQGHTV
jgi:hypothetical protein